MDIITYCIIGKVKQKLWVGQNIIPPKRRNLSERHIKLDAYLWFILLWQHSVQWLHTSDTADLNTSVILNERSWTWQSHFNNT